MHYHVAIIGAGLIGRKRAEVLKKFENCRLVVVVDINQNAAEKLAQDFSCKVLSDWKEVVSSNDINVIIVSVVNKFLTPISVVALERGKNVLCEKPLGRNAEESKKILIAAENSKGVLKAGFNHRHHKAIVKAKELFDNGKIGRMCFMRCRYGHGGRIGYEQEWRANKDLSGGGELLDQGVHVVDLFRWFAGDFDEAFGYIQSCYWDMKVEDNAFAIFRKRGGIVATMHTSWTQWKNLFSFEIFGKEGYLIIEGLGGSYGKETLKIGIRQSESGLPKEEILEFQGNDTSWEDEWKEFISAIENKRMPIGNGWDGYQANRMIDAIYESSECGRIVRLMK